MQALWSLGLMVTKDETGKWNNQAEDVIAVEPYDPRWADQFANEQQAIRECVDTSIAFVIEHFGSTAIPGLPAKPVIDILMGASSQHWPAIIEALKGIKYIHWENNPKPDREFLVKGMPPFGVRRTHHVHICELDNPLWERLLFRDYLRQHAEDRKAYADLKGRLAAEFPDDRDAYTNGKGTLVAEIMNRARTWDHR
jgi:GrpB-like predicted nucleotidyltransferase (UPF0157 family)